MSQYVIVYLGGNEPSSPEERKQHFSKYMKWIASLGESAVSPMNPLKDKSTVNSDGSATEEAQSQLTSKKRVIAIKKLALQALEFDLRELESEQSFLLTKNKFVWS